METWELLPALPWFRNDVLRLGLGPFSSALLNRVHELLQASTDW